LSGLEVLTGGIAYQDRLLQREWPVSNARTPTFSRFLIAI